MEARRTLFSLRFLSAVSLMLLCSMALFLYVQAGKYGNLLDFGRRYDEAVQRMAPLQSREALEKIEAYRDFTERQSTEDPDWLKRAGHWEEKLVMDQMERQINYRDYYPLYLEKIQREAREQQSISIFARPGTVAYENTKKTALEFSVMSGEGLDLGHDLAVTAVFDDFVADFSILAILAYLCSLFLMERKRGLWDIVRTTQGGRLRLALKRCGILFAASWIAVLALFGGRIAAAGFLYGGLGEWSRRLQAIEMFHNVPYGMTVGQFWLFFLTVKALGSFMISLLFWLILSSVSQLSLAVLVAALVLGVEFGLSFLPPSSAWILLRYINVFSYISYIRVFTSYLNLPVLGGLISSSWLVLLLLLPLSLMLLTANLLVAAGKYPVSRRSHLLQMGEKIGLIKERLCFGRPLLIWECHKLFIKRMGILVLAALFLWALRADAPYRLTLSPLQEALEDFYARKYAGPVSEERIKEMESELAVITASENRMVLEKLLQEARVQGRGGWIVPPGPYEAIWSRNTGNYHRLTALISLLFLVLLLYPIESQERQAQLTMLLRTARQGRKSLWVRKTWVCVLAAFLVWLAVYGAELLHTKNTYGDLLCLEAPLSLLKDFSGWSFSIGTGLVLYYALKLLVLLAAGFCIRLLSGFINSNRGALLLNLVLIILPASLVTLGVEAASSLSFLKPLAAVELFGEIIPYIGVGLTGGLALIFSYTRTCTISSSNQYSA